MQILFLPARRACLIALAAGVVAAGAAGAEPREPAAEKTVTLIVDYGDGVQKHFTQLLWQKGITVLDVTTAASKHRRGIRFRHKGRGATAFLTQIDDLENQAGGRNWLFRVNGKLADRSCGVVVLQAGDTVLWTFDEYR